MLQSCYHRDHWCCWVKFMYEVHVVFMVILNATFVSVQRRGGHFQRGQEPSACLFFRTHDKILNASSQILAYLIKQEQALAVVNKISLFN